MSLDRHTRRKLSALGRGQPAPGDPPAASSQAPVKGRPRGARLLSVGQPEELHGPLEELLPGEVAANEAGEYYELTWRLEEFGDWAPEALERLQRSARDGRFPGALQPRGNVTPSRLVFMDTETTGLAHTPLFLVGLLEVEEAGVTLRQLLARDYSEEPAVLHEARERLHAPALTVTYNGQSFDLPYLVDRLRYHRLEPLRLKHHLDLLLVARRQIGRRYGNCRLQTLETHLCRRRRAHDIPGAEIPQAYHDFVADGDACRLRRIIEHNSYDLITLAELGAHLAEGE